MYLVIFVAGILFINCIVAEHDTWTSRDLEDAVLDNKETELTAVILQQKQMLLDMAKGLESTKLTVYELKERLDTQSSKIFTQETYIAALNEKVSLLSERIDQQNLVIHELREDNKVLRKANQDTSTLLETNTLVQAGKAETYEDVFSNDVKHAAGYVVAAKRPETNRKFNEKNMSNKNSHTRFVLNLEGPVAFHAVDVGYEIAHLSLNQSVPFQTVLLNIGGQYHSSTSLFIAEQPGVYIFSASLMSYIQPHEEFVASIVKNDVVLARVFGHGDNGRHDQGSATVFVQLIAGDELWVRMESTDTSLYGDKFTTFTGALLWNI